MWVSPSYLIGDGGFLLGPTVIAAVRDLDDTSLHAYLAKRARPPSVRDHVRWKNFDNERCHEPHINRNQITDEYSFLDIRKTG